MKILEEKDFIENTQKMNNKEKAKKVLKKCKDCKFYTICEKRILMIHKSKTSKTHNIYFYLEEFSDKYKCIE